MPMSAEQLVLAGEFGTYLGDDSLNTARADMILQQAQNACEQVVDPLPDDKLFVLYRVAERAYTAGRNQGRGYQFASSGVDDGGAPSAAGVYLTQWDRQDLLGDEETAASVAAPEAFTIHARPLSCGPAPWAEGCW